MTWGGDPLEAGPGRRRPSQLSPRRSFAQWHQLVEGKCEPWSPADLTAARLIGETVADVVLQFRSVRLLIAQDQLTHVTKQVQISESAGRHRRRQGPNPSQKPRLRRLLPKAHPTYEFIDDLVRCSPIATRRAGG